MLGPGQLPNPLTDQLTKSQAAQLQRLPCGTCGGCFLQLLLPLPLLLWKLEFAAAKGILCFPFEQLQFPIPSPGNVHLSLWLQGRLESNVVCFGLHGGLCFS